jgi:hypothetical protein
MMRVKWPATDADIVAAGYSQTPEIKKCSGRRCGATIELWLDPKKKSILMHRLGSGKLQPHYKDCPDSQVFYR